LIIKLGRILLYHLHIRFKNTLNLKFKIKQCKEKTTMEGRGIFQRGEADIGGILPLPSVVILFLRFLFLICKFNDLERKARRKETSWKT
jgi:hypothetical protein